MTEVQHYFRATDKSLVDCARAYPGSIWNESYILNVNPGLRRLASVYLKELVFAP